jgi:hypothetical protein
MVSTNEGIHSERNAHGKRKNGGERPEGEEEEAMQNGAPVFFRRPRPWNGLEPMGCSLMLDTDAREANEDSMTDRNRRLFVTALLIQLSTALPRSCIVGHQSELRSPVRADSPVVGKSAWLGYIALTHLMHSATVPPQHGKRMLSQPKQRAGGMLWQAPCMIDSFDIPASHTCFALKRQEYGGSTILYMNNGFLTT